jgi:hypothetical protein
MTMATKRAAAALALALAIPSVAPGDKEVPVSMMNVTRAPIRLRIR